MEERYAGLCDASAAVAIGQGHCAVHCHRYRRRIAGAAPAARLHLPYELLLADMLGQFRDPAADVADASPTYQL